MDWISQRWDRYVLSCRMCKDRIAKLTSNQIGRAEINNGDNGTCMVSETLKHGENFDKSKKNRRVRNCGRDRKVEGSSG